MKGHATFKDEALARYGVVPRIEMNDASGSVCEISRKTSVMIRPEFPASNFKEQDQKACQSTWTSP